ncbi:MAG: hypothetical protein WD795_16500 [Woeseia sp.]
MSTVTENDSDARIILNCFDAKYQRVEKMLDEAIATNAHPHVVKALNENLRSQERAYEKLSSTKD